jgi:hypothetical protein
MLLPGKKGLYAPSAKACWNTKADALCAAAAGIQGADENFIYALYLPAGIYMIYLMGKTKYGNKGE